MKRAFSTPTRDDNERQLLFSRFPLFGYSGLQLKYTQYSMDIDHPARFIERWGTNTSRIASGLIVGGQLDETGIQELRSLFSFAQKVGSERIIFCHGKARAGLSAYDIQGFAKILSELGKEAQQHGITLSLHHHYNQPVMYRQDFAAFFEAAGDQSVKLTIDTAHLVKSGIEDIAGIIREYHQVVDNIHLKDFADGAFKVLGQGSIDFSPVFAALCEIGFEGWLCADEESGENLLTSMEICAQFLQQAMPGEGTTAV